MRLNGVRCDSCGAEHLLDKNLLYASVGEMTPPDWYILSGGNQKDILTFCSAECLHLWFAPPVDEQLRAWEAAHPDVDCKGKLIHPYYMEQISESWKRLVKPYTPEKEAHV